MSSSDSHGTRAWPGLPQADRDAAYNNRAAIPGAEELIKARKDASREVREHFRCHLDVPYGDGPREGWDIFPGLSPNAPCLVFIHGGYWQGGDPKDFSVCVRGALEKGWSAALCGYPLAPDSTLTKIVDSVSRALSWLDENRTDYGAAGPLVLAGWSAGAHLAAIHAGHRVVTAVLCISGIYDLTPIADTFLNAKLNLSPKEIALFSPVRLQPINKPFIVAYGADELPEIRRQSVDFIQMRDAAGLPGMPLILPGANHITVLDQLYGVGSTLTLAAQTALSLAV